MFGDDEVDARLAVVAISFSLVYLSTRGVHTSLRVLHLTSNSLPKLFHSINKLHVSYNLRRGPLTLSMDRPTDSREVATADNLLVVKGNGRILSRRVSQVYGLALLGAMALRLNRLPFVELHVSFLAHHESWTPNEIRKVAQADASGDNFMFIDDGRKFISCRVNPDYGVALLEGIEHVPAEAFQARPGLSRGTVAPTSEIGNNQGIKVESPQHTSQELRQAHAFSSSPPPSTSGTLANNIRILSDQILSSGNRQPYDRDWMKKYSISEDCLDGCQSKHKLDALLRQGAVKVGDKLCVTYQSNGGPVFKTGEVGSRANHPPSLPPIMTLTSNLF